MGLLSRQQARALQAAILRHAYCMLKYLPLYLWGAGESGGERPIVSQSLHAVLSVYKYGSAI